jgi:hypothetical protein
VNLTPKLNSPKEIAEVKMGSSPAADEKHYQLVASNAITAGDLEAYAAHGG